MNRWLIVAGDFVQTGGMDMANFALAQYLAAKGLDVHLVAHRVDPALSAAANVHVHRVPRPGGVSLLGEPLLNWKGRRLAARVAGTGGRVVVNGGNCRWGDINWVHFLHAAWEPKTGLAGVRRTKTRLAHRLALAHERRAFQQASVVIANSETTRQEAMRRFSLPASRVHTVYLGVDPSRFRPRSEHERQAARRRLAWDADKPVVAFVGALGDRRKGFDTVLESWRRLCRDARWDVDLAVVGSGAEAPLWRRRIEGAGLARRVHFLGFRRDVSEVLAACAALIAPTRYEPYGLAAHEALCSGLPAFVTRTAGVAERYPVELDDLLIEDPEAPEELVERLAQWRRRRDEVSARVLPVTERLRHHTWDAMAREFVKRVEANGENGQVGDCEPR